MPCGTTGDLPGAGSTFMASRRTDQPGIPMVSTLLVAVDGSALAYHALRLAIAWGKGWDAAVHAIYVMKREDRPALPTSSTLYTGEDPGLAFVSRIVEQKVAEIKKRVAEIAAEHGIAVSLHKKTGDPGSRILACAAELAADLIIVGSRGTGTLERLLLGSVSSYVVQHSPVTTVVVKAPAETA
jgi:nucleotide-binding universal stress UspA family protein